MGVTLEALDARVDDLDAHQRAIRDAVQDVAVSLAELRVDLEGTRGNTGKLGTLAASVGQLAADVEQLGKAVTEVRPVVELRAWVMARVRAALGGLALLAGTAFAIVYQRGRADERAAAATTSVEQRLDRLEHTTTTLQRALWRDFVPYPPLPKEPLP